jgi:DNA sulfur modification protein DndD
MIQFVSITLSNFAVYKGARITFSTEAGKPLTVFRAANQSGKTTLMRSLLWVLFGPSSLPPATRDFNPIRPPASNQTRVETRVTLRYRILIPNGVPQEYVLTRVASTGGPGCDGDLSKFSGERVDLSAVKDGAQDPLDFPEDRLQQQFRPSMRGFFFVDADQAVEYLGGPDSVADTVSMRRAITHALNVLLALDQLRTATNRVGVQRQDLTRRFARHGQQSTDTQRLSEEYDAAIARRRDLQERLESATAKSAEAREAFDRAEVVFVAKLRDTEQTQHLYQQREEAINARNDARLRKREAASSLSEYLQSPGLLTAILRPVFGELVELLEPMKQAGYIPMTERAIIARLLTRGHCLCGCDLLANPVAEARLRQLQHQDEHLEAGSRVLDQALESARRHRDYGAETPDTFSARAIDNLLQDLRQSDLAEYESNERLRRLEDSIGDVGDVTRSLQSLKENRDAAAELVRAQDEELSQLSTSVEAEQSTVRSLEEKIRIRGGQSLDAKRLQLQIDACRHLETVLIEAHSRIEQEQVEEVSKNMEAVYRAIIGATRDGFDGNVGVRALGASAGQPNQYELFAKTADGVEKPLGMLNGASRRVLGIAFVLALADSANSRIPLVADSLLHATDTEVRRNLVRHLCDPAYVAQPIIFGTFDDFAGEDVRQVLAGAAGATYTLTAQAHVRDAEGRGAVVRRSGDSGDLVSICRCGPSEYCEICERHGVAHLNLSKRLVGT